MHQDVSERGSGSDTRPATKSARPRRRHRSLRVGGGSVRVAFVTSATTMNAKDLSNLESATARAYFTTLLRADGRSEPVTAGRWQFSTRPCPMASLPRAFAPWNQLLYALPVVRPDAAIDQLRARRHSVSPDGALVPMRFQRGSGTPRGLPLAAVIGGSGATPTCRVRRVAMALRSRVMLHQCPTRRHDRRSARVADQHAGRLAARRIGNVVGRIRERVDVEQRSGRTGGNNRSGPGESGPRLPFAVVAADFGPSGALR